MAKVYAQRATDLLGINLNDLIAHQTSFNFYDNTNGTIHGQTYQDTLRIGFNAGVASYAWFGGTGFAFNAGHTSMTAGTVNAYLQQVYVGGSYVNAWGIENFSFSGVTMYEAAKTAGTADDRAVLAAILSGADSFALSSGADRASGYAGDDTMSGNAGEDTLYGGAGNDRLDGGSGVDSLVGGVGNDTYVVDVAGDVTTETSTLSTEIDRVYSGVNRTLGANLEQLVLTGSADRSGTGNELDNRIWGNAGSNALYGAAGDDTLSGGGGNDTLQGGTGIDSMAGGTGNDRYYVDVAGDVTIETSTLSTEIDRVYSSVDRALGANLEELVLTGSADLEGEGNDLANRLWGNAGANELEGEGGNDTLSGGGGNDVLAGGAGTDSMAGGSGDDTYYVDVDDDVTLETSTLPGEIDRVYADVTRILGANLEQLVLTGSADNAGYGNGLDNLVVGNSGANLLAGLDGNDTLDGAGGIDNLVGGSGNDTYVVDVAEDVTTETSTSATEIDRVYAGVSRALGANLEELVLTGSGNTIGYGNELANTIWGNAGSNVLYGYEANDTLRGGDGTDNLVGGSGVDSMEGGSGNDSYFVDVAGDETVETSTLAGEIDRVYSDVTRTLGANLEILVLTGSADNAGYGNGLDNVIDGNSGANQLYGDDGNDTLNGYGGIDTMVGGSGNDAYVVDVAGDVTSETSTVAGEIDRVYSEVTRTLGANLEQLVLTGSGNNTGYGNELANVLIGNAGSNVLYGYDAGDLLYGGDGSDALVGGAGVDSMEGGNGNDIYYVDVAGDVTIETSSAAGEIDRVYSSVSRTLGDNLEELYLNGSDNLYGYGNGLANTIWGNSGSNVLYGFEADDTLYGGIGGDYLVGGSGVDSMVGGSGNDTYYVDVAGDVTSETSTDVGEIDRVYSEVTRALGANLEQLVLTGSGNNTGYGNELANAIWGNSGSNVLYGYDANDTLNGGDGTDYLVGGAGADSMMGGNGNDFYYVDVAGDVTNETSAAAGEIDRVYSDVTRTLGANLEILVLTGSAGNAGYGNGLDNVIEGNSGANQLYGYEGNDTLNGYGGIDTMVGGSGNDTYYVDVAGDVTTETSTVATEIDRVYSDVTRTLGANLEELVLTGSGNTTGYGNELANTIWGNAGSNVLYGYDANDTLYGNGGSDYLVGGTGVDSMLGGSGNDYYYVDEGGDETIETSTVAGEIDRVYSEVTRTLGANLEQLVLSGSAGNSGYGNELANTIWGNTGANYLWGGAGNDTLYGGDGSDTLYSSGGVDSMVGGNGNDYYYVDVAGDETVETSTLVTEIDRVYSEVTRTLGANLEQLVLTGSGNTTGYGNELANTLWGNTGSNVLYGYDANDTMYGNGGSDYLVGGAGVDSMVGGSGNDYYYVDVAGDVTTEDSTVAGEIDRVYSDVSRTLGANLEELVLTGSAGNSGYGNELANTLWGNAGSNVLYGYDANDTLNGGDGTDYLVGGTGADSMLGGNGNDYYYVDVAGDETVETSTVAGEIDRVYSEVSRTLGANLEQLVLSGSAGNSGYGNELANTIWGNSGSNYLWGGAGDDTLYGGDGSDTLYSSGGVDLMEGGNGNDYYYVDVAGDVTNETSTLAGEIDRVYSEVTRTLGANLEQLVLTGSGNTTGYGNELANTLWGNTGSNVLYGYDANDTLNGGDGTDYLVGGAGVDSMVGGSGNDFYYVDVAGDVTTETSTLASEIDRVYSDVSRTLGANLEQLVLTGGGNTYGYGNELSNALSGGTGSNTLYGLGANDVLNGGSGNDYLAGGAGLDRFQFTAALNASTNVDLIGDFASADDSFDLDNAVFTTIGATGQLAADAFRYGTAAADATDRVIYDSASGNLYFDADGTGATSAVLFARVQTGTSLSYQDIWVI